MSLTTQNFSRRPNASGLACLFSSSHCQKHHPKDGISPCHFSFQIILVLLTTKQGNSACPTCMSLTNHTPSLLPHAYATPSLFLLPKIAIKWDGLFFLLPLSYLIFFLNTVLLTLESKGERKSLISCSCLHPDLHPDQGQNPQRRYVPQLGIEPASFSAQRTLNQLSHTNWGCLVYAHSSS